MKPPLSSFRWKTAALVASCCVATAYSLDTVESLVVCSPDATHLATAAEQGRIQYRRAGDYTVEGVFYICHPRAISFSKDGKLLAAAGGRNGSPARIKVWRLGDHQQLCDIISPGEGVNVLTLSSDCHIIAGVSTDGRVEVWRVSDGQAQWSRTLSIPAKSIQFSPDSRRLVVRADNGDERQFNAGNGRPVIDRGH